MANLVSRVGDFNKAFVVGGYGQSPDALGPLAEAIGDHAGFNLNKTPDVATLGKAMLFNRSFNREASRRLVVALSFGPRAVNRAGAIIVLNGAEPTPIKDQIDGVKADTQEHRDQMGREPHVPEFSPMGMYLEYAKHPIVAATTPFRIRNFSTLDKLIDHGVEAYPGGRAYFPGIEDEYGFGHNGEVERAREHGIVADMFPGFHGQALYHPQATAQRIYDQVDGIILR